jgi:hypothetical protein
MWEEVRHMDENRLARLLQEWQHRGPAQLDPQRLDLDSLNETELAQLHGWLLAWRGQIDAVEAEVTSLRAEKWWGLLPPEEARTLRLLLKGARLTPQALQRVPELSHLLLLLDIEDPQVVRMWAQMAPEVRAKRIEDLRTAMELTEMKRTASSWEDQKESTLLAYEVLGLTANCTWADVRSAYREKVGRHHPDKGGDPQLFKALQTAYRMLEARFL